MARKPTDEEETDRGSEVFMREVDEAVREADMQAFMLRYGWWVAGVIIIGLAALAGWIYWQNHQAEQAGIRSEEYIAALDSLQANNAEGAENALKGLGDAEQQGYRSAAELMRANIALQNDKSEDAIKIYQAVVADAEAPQSWRDLALIRQTTVEFDKLKPEEVIKRLEPMAVTGNAWHGSAGEMVALSYLSIDNKKRAGEIFAAITKDEAVPSTIRSRARQMAGLLGIDTLEADDEMLLEPAAAPAAPAVGQPAQGE